MARVVLSSIEKRFGETRVLKGVDIQVPDGGFAVLVGPSGCGKSTLLRIIAGLEETDTGSVTFGDRNVTDLAPRDRDIAMVFQSYALYPHLTVRDNLAFGLSLRKTPKSEIAERIKEVSAMLGLDALLERFPRQLSGGQRQRVAMGRAIARRPQVFLFDEPLSNLDAALRAQVRVDIRKLHDRLEATSIYVTHDQVEAMTLADVLFVLNQGCVEQSGPPLEVYARPRTRFVASFLGSPAMNFLTAEAEQVGDRLKLSAPGVDLALPPLTQPPPKHVVVGIRPHDVFFAEDGGLQAEVDVLEALGSESFAHAQVGKEAFVARLPGSAQPARGSTLRLSVRDEDVHIFDTDSGVSLRAPEAT
ncbi:MAG TPA: sn-glycerol-3-phosphate ABC transporter ATP-binding protein UgpC [Polyangiaceae bacterium]|nr:sn-glycerol-3-phosphate ABC transporter ATP-binding protein UgpC [Polyangiaceae bacterium]